MTHAVCPVSGVQASEREAGKAVTVVGVPVDLPGSQSAQAMVEAVPNLATAHAVHEMAPAAVSVLVTEPAAQLAHATVEAALNVPAAQATQVVPPALARVSVMEPEAQVAHATVEAALYFPGIQAVQEIAPRLVSVLVTEPAAQAVHEVCPAEDVYVPAAQSVAPRQLAVVLLVVQDVDPPLVVTRYLPAAACVHVPPVKSVAELA